MQLVSAHCTQLYTTVAVKFWLLADTLALSNDTPAHQLGVWSCCSSELTLLNSHYELPVTGVLRLSFTPPTGCGC